MQFPEHLRRAFARPARYDSTTGERRRPRYGWRAVAAGIALALVTGSGLAVAAGAVAEAHNHAITWDCTGIHLVGSQYNTNGGGVNTVAVTIAGVAQSGTVTVDGASKSVTSPFTFNSSFDAFFAFDNSTKAFAFTAEIHGHDGYDQVVAAESTPCIPPTIVELSVPRCDAVGGTTDLTASFQQLVKDRPYVLTLTSTKPVSNPVTFDFTPDQATKSYTWPGLEPGFSYTVTITDSTNRDLTATKSVDSIGCPQQSGISIDPTECVTAGGDATYTATATELTIGREYRIDIIDSSTKTSVATKTFTANATHETLTSTVAALGTYYATVADTAVGGLAIQSASTTFLPCPQSLVKPTLTVSDCNVLPPAATASGGTIGLTVTGLVPGRSYTISVAGPTLVPTVTDLTATSSSYTAQLTGLAAGTYTATVTDALVRAFTSTNQALLIACPTDASTVSLSAIQCSTAGGFGSITASISGYAVGRSYTVTLSRNSTVIDSRTFSGAAINYTDLTPDSAYRVTLIDDRAVPAVNVASDVTLAACPGSPSIRLQARCDSATTETVSAALSALVVGHNYTAALTETSTGKPVSTIPAQSFVANASTATLAFTKVPGAISYTVTLADSQQQPTAQSRILLTLCDLPTLSLPRALPTLSLPSSRTLAFTGESPLVPAVVGIGMLQLGLVFVGIGLVRRRLRRL